MQLKWNEKLMEGIIKEDKFLTEHKVTVKKMKDIYDFMVIGYELSQGDGGISYPEFVAMEQYLKEFKKEFVQVDENYCCRKFEVKDIIDKDSIKIEEKLNLKEVTSVETEKGLLRCITLTTEVDENEMDKLAMKHSLELNKYFKSINNKMNIQNVYATQIKNKITTYIWYYI